MARIALLLVLVSAALLACQGSIVLKSNGYDLTAVEVDNKNAGSFSSNDTEEAGIFAFGSTAQTVGSQARLLANAMQSQNASAAQTLLSASDDPSSLLPGKNDGASQSLLASAAALQLKYYKGKVFSKKKGAAMEVSLIFYGMKWTPAQMAVIKNFVVSLDPPTRVNNVNLRTVANWWNTTVSYYYDTNMRPITDKVKLKSAIVDTGSAKPRGTKNKPLTTKIIRDIVINNLPKLAPPTQRSAYIVLTSEEVYVRDFCSSICNYHSSFRKSKMTIAYGFVGNPASQCPQACSYRYFDPYYNPANDLGADAVVNWLANALTKIATNPAESKKSPPGWTVKGAGLENGDLCAWDFGYVGFTTKYATYNLVGYNNARYLIQRNFNTRTKQCVIIARDKADDPMSMLPS